MHLLVVMMSKTTINDGKVGKTLNFVTQKIIAISVCFFFFFLIYEWNGSFNIGSSVYVQCLLVQIRTSFLINLFKTNSFISCLNSIFNYLIFGFRIHNQRQYLRYSSVFFSDLMDFNLETLSISLLDKTCTSKHILLKFK